MRMVIFFDLPQISEADKREYRNFHKFLVKNGFLMMQNSVYSKILLNASNMNSVKNIITKNLPKQGNVQLLCITEKQFAGIEFLVGKKISDVIDSDKRVIELWNLRI